MSKKAVITVTFGDSGENHIGNQQIGNRVREGDGFTLLDFQRAKDIIDVLFSFNLKIFSSIKFDICI